MANTRFQKGEGGNPKGRPPKGHALADLLRAKLDEVDENGVSARQRIMAKLLMMAEAGELDAIKVVLDRIDGKVPELRKIEGSMSIELSWADGNGDGN